MNRRTTTDTHPHVFSEGGREYMGVLGACDFLEGLGGSGYFSHAARSFVDGAFWSSLTRISKQMQAAIVVLLS